MTPSTLVKIEMPFSVEQYKLPKGVDKRLRGLLDKQDRGEKLTTAEKNEAEGLVELAEVLSLLRRRAETLLEA